MNSEHRARLDTAELYQLRAERDKLRTENEALRTQLTDLQALNNKLGAELSAIESCA